MSAEKFSRQKCRENNVATKMSVQKSHEKNVGSKIVGSKNVGSKMSREKCRDKKNVMSTLGYEIYRLVTDLMHV